MLSGKTSCRSRSRHTRPSSAAVCGDWSRDATKAALSAPTEVPTRKSGVMPRSYSASSIPTCSAPRLAPPERTNAVRGLEAPPVASLCGGCSATVVIALLDTRRVPRRARNATADKQRRRRRRERSSGRRARSWRVPERVTKRVGRVGGRNPERDQSVGAYVVDDDLGLPGVAIPLERHGETVAASCVELNEHRATRACGTALRPRAERHAVALRPGEKAARRPLGRGI